jgi:N-methylhydantoinase B/oxoprolinase/acetone carboxylase alpha subunit
MTNIHEHAWNLDVLIFLNFQIKMFLSIVTISAVLFKTAISLNCYECTDYVPCGINDQGSIVTNCPTCMVYQNQYDSS